MDQDVVDADRRHTRHERLPNLAAVLRDKQTKLCADVQQILILRILLDDVDVPPLRQIINDRSPGSPVVFRHEHVRLHVVKPMTINREITSSRVVTRRFHARDMVSVSDARHVLADVGPGGAAVSTDLNVAVVSSDPQYAWDLRRLRHRHDVTVSGITVVLGRHRVFARHAHDRQRAAIDLFREIGSSGPRVAPIHRSEQTIAADKHDPRIVRRKMNRRAPVETIGLADGRCRNNVRWKTSGAATTESLRRRKLSKLRCGVGSWRGCSCRTRARRWRSSAARTLALSTRTRLAARSNTHASSRAQIQTLHGSALRFRVNDVVVRRINLRVKAVAAGDAIPISVGNSYLQISRLAWTTPRAVVLQSAVDVIGLTHIDADCVELRGRNR